MKKKKRKKQQNKTLRTVRKIHRITAAYLFIFFLFISVTGILLGWKKNTNGYISPVTQTGTTENLKEWLSLDSLHSLAVNVLHDSVSDDHSTKLERIDVRKEKGIAKFIFKENFYEIQLDGSTGEVLQIGKRRSDLIEMIHDGSILDYLFDTQNIFKLIYSTLTGLALLIFTITGFWLWYAPKVK